MRGAAKLTAIALSSVVALGAATFAGYMLSVLWAGKWKYTELIAPICGSVFAAVLAAGCVAYIGRRHRGAGAVVRLGALLALGCFTAAAVLFFGLLANCRLSCENRILAESQSPDGRWKAVSFSRNCVAVAGYCPSVSYVSVLPAREELPEGEGNVFGGIVPDGALEVGWKSDDQLLIRHSARVFHQQERVGGVRVEYQQVGWM
jgi:hypothetical protein